MAHTMAANIAEELGKKTEIKKSVRLLKQLKDYKKKVHYKDLNLTKNKGGRRSLCKRWEKVNLLESEMQNFFPFLNCNICIA